jgi:hypothetical protein
MAVAAGAGGGSSAGGPVVTLRPLGIGEVLDAAIKVYRSRPRQMVLASAVVTAPAIVVQTLVQVSAGDPSALTETDAATGLPTVDGGAFATYLGGLLVSTLVLIVANNLALAGTTRMSLSAYLGDDTDWRDSLRFALRRFWPLTALLALSTLGLAGGVVLCVIPAIWLQGIWAVAVPALLVEERGAVDSLRRSASLVKGRFWPVLGAIVLGSLLASVLQGVLTAPVIGLQLVGTSFLITSLLLGVVQLVAVALTTPFVAALTAVIYIDLRVRKEAFDLELLARGVGVDPPPPDATGPDATGPGGAPGAGERPAGPVAAPGGWVPAAPPEAWRPPSGSASSGAASSGAPSSGAPSSGPPSSRAASSGAAPWGAGPDG